MQTDLAGDCLVEVEKVVEVVQAQPGADEEAEHSEGQLMQLVQQVVMLEVAEEELPVLMLREVEGLMDATDYCVQMHSGQLGRL